MYPDFIRSCPNLESLTFRDGFGKRSCDALSSYGAGLKRVAGVDNFFVLGTECEFLKMPSDPGNRSMGLVLAVVRDCPKLQEISLHGGLRVRPNVPSAMSKKRSRCTHNSLGGTL